MRGGGATQPALLWDAGEVRAALDRPASEYLAYAGRPGVAAALAQFRSERDVHQTERLDLVTWVQYICAFGVSGPSEDAWTQLFHACRFPNEGAVAQDLGGDSPLKTGDFLREHEIAVLLAHAKVAPDPADAMTHAALIKHRIKPAVFGRNDARTPGIIRHVSAKFEDWIFGYMTKWMCHYIVQEFSPTAFLPGFPDFSILSAGVQGLKQCADAHAAKNVKDWGDVVMHLLEIDHNTISPRAARFEEKAQETRSLLYVRFYAKISEFCLSSMQSGGLMGPDPATVVHSALKSEATAHAHYRDASSILAPSQLHPHDALVRAALAAGAGPDGSSAALTAAAYATVKALCGLRAVPRMPPAGRTVRAFVRILELHAPKYQGEAALEFVEVDCVKKGAVYHGRRAAAAGAGALASLRLANFASPDRMTRVCGAGPAPYCRALELEVCVAVLPPSRSRRRSSSSGSGSVPVLRVMDFAGARWVPLGKFCGGCEELEKLTEMGYECDAGSSSGSDDDPSRLAPRKDPAAHWLGGPSGVAAALAGARAAAWTVEHVCDGIRKFSYDVAVPARMANDARAEAGVPPRPNADGVERFREHCWIDCNTGARASYAVSPGTEIAAKAPRQAWMFERLPAWRWRAS